MKKILLALALAFFTIPTSFAGSVDMTCAQAKNYYNRHGRIYVRTNGSDIVPIYVLRRRCPPRIYRFTVLGEHPGREAMRSR
jgi:hypothetical protein